MIQFGGLGGPDVALPGHTRGWPGHTVACCRIIRPQRCGDGRTDGRRADGRTPGGRRAVRESLWPRVSTHTRTPKIATPPLRGDKRRLGQAQAFLERPSWEIQGTPGNSPDHMDRMASLGVPLESTQWSESALGEIPMNSYVDCSLFCSSASGFSICLLYTSPSPRDLSTSRMPSSA